MDADRRFLESGHDTDLARGAVAVVTEHEHGALPPVELIHGCRDGRAALSRQQGAFGIRPGSPAHSGGPLAGRRRVRRHEPSIPTSSRFAAIQTAVDENAREPDLEWPCFAVRADA